MEHMAEDKSGCLKTLAAHPTVIGTRCPLSHTADSGSVIEVLFSFLLKISVGLLHSETEHVIGEIEMGAIMVFVYKRF